MRMSGRLTRVTMTLARGDETRYGFQLIWCDNEKAQSDVGSCLCLPSFSSVLPRPLLCLTYATYSQTKFLYTNADPVAMWLGLRKRDLKSLCEVRKQRR